MSGSHGYSRCSPHRFIDGRPGVVQLGHVLHSGQSLGSHNAFKLFNDFSLNLRISQHVDESPQEGGLNCFEPSAEQVKQDLLHLGLRIFVIKDLIESSLLPALFDFHEVLIHQIAWLSITISVQLSVSKIGLVVLDNIINKLQQLESVGTKLFYGATDIWQKSEERQKDCRPSQGK